MGFTVVITDHDFATLEPEERVLRPLGIPLEVLTASNRTAFRPALARADAVINQFVPLDAELIAAMPRCLLHVRSGVGYAGIDAAAATPAGIRSASVPD